MILDLIFLLGSESKLSQLVRNFKVHWDQFKEIFDQRWLTSYQIKSLMGEKVRGNSEPVFFIFLSVAIDCLPIKREASQESRNVSYVLSLLWSRL